MEANIPKGMKIFAAFLILASIIGIKNLFKDDAGTILFAHAINGPAFIFYYSSILSANCIIAVALLLLKRWAFVCYFLLSAFFIFNVIVNLFFVRIETLAELSWKISNSSLIGYRLIGAFTIFLTVVFAFWLYSYRKLFLHKEKRFC